MCGRDGKCANSLGEKDLLNLQLPQPLIWGKKAISMSNNKVKHNK